MKMLLKKTTPLLPILLLLTSFLTACSQSSLPDQWTDDMVLKVTYGGGMPDYSSTMEIKAGACYFESRSEGKLRRTEFTCTRQELNGLLATLKKNRFDQVGMEVTMVYDKGTTSSTLSWGQHSYNISDGATMQVAEKWEKEYQAIQGAIYSLMAIKTGTE